MGQGIDEVSLQIGALNAKVDTLQEGFVEFRHELRGLSNKLDDQISNSKETKARILGIGAGVGLAGGGAAVAIKDFITRVFT